jgi:hypothetical protein
MARSELHNAGMSGLGQTSRGEFGLMKARGPTTGPNISIAA